jgi:GT2 family glycosyltransferase
MVVDGDGMPTKVLDVDLATGLRDLDGLAPYERAVVLVRWRGRPLGQLRLVVEDGRIEGGALRDAATATFGTGIATARVADMLPPLEGDLVPPTLPTATVIVCTRDRPDDLRRCLERLQAHRPRDVQILVVDNAPSDDRAADVSRRQRVGYVREARPGLGWARTRGAAVADTEIVLFTDDDVLVDAGWADALRRPFQEPDVAAVTGLVMPFELETEAQELFEAHFGFVRGFERRDFTALTVSPVAAGTVGAGASMAFRRDLVRDLDLFAVELGAGTVAAAGEDMYAFYRLLSRGHRIVYTPEAVAWHRHRRERATLERQLRGYGIGTMCFLLRCLLHHGEGEAVQSLWWNLRHHLLPRLWRGIRGGPDAPPLAITVAEARGWVAGPTAYVASRLRERQYRHGNTAADCPRTERVLPGELP